MAFKMNVGKLDAVLRVGVGAILIYVGFINTNLIDDNLSSTLLGIFGLIVFMSGVARHCPLYNLIGFSSCSKDQDR